MWSTYHCWPQLCHLWGLILKPQGWMLIPLPSNHPTWRQNKIRHILFTQYLVLNIAHTSTSILHILLNLSKWKILKFILEILSMMYMIKYIFPQKNYIHLNLFFWILLNWITFQWYLLEKKFKHMIYKLKIFYT
jgi:hypothetical protein